MIIRWFALLLILSPLQVSASTLDAVFATVGQEYQIDPDYLKAVAMKESGLNPWALNINGVPCTDVQGFVIGGTYLACDSKRHTIQILQFVISHPWYASARDAKGVLWRSWLPSRAEAYAFVKRLGGGTVERKNTASTDIGLMQTNLAAHPTLSEVGIDNALDPMFNVRYAAWYIATLNAQYGPTAAAGMYHTGPRGPEHRQRSYRTDVLRNYLALKAAH